MSKKVILMGMLVTFLFQTQAMAASSDEAQKEILSRTAQKSLPNKDKKSDSYRVIWSRQEDDKVKMNQADREREILGNSQRAVSVPVDTDEDAEKAEKKKKAKKEKAKKAKQAEQKKDSANNTATENDGQPMHSSSMAWDNPNVSKNMPDAEIKDGSDGKDADKKAKKKKEKKERVVSQADRERDILGSKGNRTW